MEKLSQLMQEHFIKNMCSTGKLYVADITGRDVWHEYLNSFENPGVWRNPQSNVYNCNHCSNFIRRYGNIVALNQNLELVTIFDVEIEGEYAHALKTLSTLIKSKAIANFFVETINELNELPYEKISRTAKSFQLGVAKNHKQYTKEEVEKFGRVTEDKVYTFHHFNLNIPKEFISFSGNSSDSIKATARDNVKVFERALVEIPLDTLELVRDLITQGSLLNGEAQLSKVSLFIQFKTEYEKVEPSKRSNWCWKYVPEALAKFKNELIGKLCSDLAEGMELNKACQEWNKLVDPVNYMKTTAPITKRQIQEAEKFVTENDYTASFNRRNATIDDMKASEIKHMKSDGGEAKPVGSIFDGVKPSTSTRHKKSEFDGIEEVSIDKFMADILPKCTSIEAFLKNNHETNMVTMTTAENDESKPIFKWDNNYSWTYNGNLAGKSMIKEEVKSKGGLVDGILRFSISWNESGSDNSDLDAWCLQPDRQKIGFSESFRKDRGNYRSSCGGQLDVDIMNPSGRLAVENIAFESLSKMNDGVYKFWVNPYSGSGSQGFKAEIEFNGEIYTYEYNRSVAANVVVAEVTLKNGVFSIEHKLPSAESNKEIYGLETNTFHPVNLVCLSPNHWGTNEAGNKHYFFMLKDAKNPVSIRSFHNENLSNALAEHRKVMEVLANTKMLAPTTGKELTGLGFNATVRDEIILKLGGTFKRVIKVKF